MPYTVTDWPAVTDADVLLICVPETESVLEPASTDAELFSPWLLTSTARVPATCDVRVALNTRCIDVGVLGRLPYEVAVLPLLPMPYALLVFSVTVQYSVVR